MFSRKISCKAKLGKEIHGIGKGLNEGWLLMGKRVGTSCEELAMGKRVEKGTVGLGPTKDPPISPKIRR